MTLEGLFDNAKERLLPHAAHDIQIAWYGNKSNPVNIAVECMECSEVLIDFMPEEEPNHDTD
jgi:hypothetical protein